MVTLQQPSFFRLPGELRNEIYTLVQTSPTPIINPSFDRIIRPKHQSIPTFGIDLASTCHAIHEELDPSILLRNNEFVFSRAEHVHAFFRRLSLEQARALTSITIDLREAACGYPNDLGSERADAIANEWLHYLFCDHSMGLPGVGCARLSTLRADALSVRAIVVDFDGWQPLFGGSRQAGWKYLQTLLINLRKLDSLTLRGTGIDARTWFAALVSHDQDPEATMLARDSMALITLMGQCVAIKDDQTCKEISWSVKDGISSICIQPWTKKSREQTMLPVSDQSRPTSVCISWRTFQDFVAGRTRLQDQAKTLLAVDEGHD